MNRGSKPIWNGGINRSYLKTISVYGSPTLQKHFHNMTQQQIEEAVMGYAELKERVARLEHEVELLKEKTSFAEVDEDGNVTCVQ